MVRIVGHSLTRLLLSRLIIKCFELPQGRHIFSLILAEAVGARVYLIISQIIEVTRIASHVICAIDLLKLNNSAVCRSHFSFDCPKWQRVR